MYILSLSSSSIRLETAGGKGLNLARLTRAGFNGARVYYLDRGILCLCGGKPLAVADRVHCGKYSGGRCGHAEKTSAQIRAAFAVGVMPPDVEAAIRAAAAEFAGTPVAVRSSATAEDLPDKWRVLQYLVHHYTRTKEPTMKRREFLKGTAAAAAMLSYFPASLAGVEREIPKDGIEQRALGKTGEKLSVIGFGSFVLRDATPEQGRLWVRRSLWSRGKLL